MDLLYLVLTYHPMPRYGVKYNSKNDLQNADEPDDERRSCRLARHVEDIPLPFFEKRMFAVEFLVFIGIAEAELSLNQISKSTGL